MKCQGVFKYKGISKRDGGSFTNNRGQLINYSDSYVVKLDELCSDGVFERSFKLAIDSPLIPMLSNLKLYQEVRIEFDVLLYNSGCKVVPVALISDSNNK